MESGQILTWSPEAYNAPGSEGRATRRHVTVQFIDRINDKLARVRRIAYPGSGVEVSPVLGDVYEARIDELHPIA